MAAAERIFKLLDEHPEIVSPAHPQSPSAGSSAYGRIEFQDVWFTYQRLSDDQLHQVSQPGRDSGTPGSSRAWVGTVEWILRGVSFTLEPNETAAIVGHTGAGKTTITALMMRFYDIQRGQILVDGIDIREQDLTQLRERFGVVLQDPFLFSGTIADNIRLGTARITEARVEQAADEVNVGDFIRSLPAGLQRAGARARRRLSTGQKQLISFARALAHDPGILILDEATSSVDTETELRVRLALDPHDHGAHQRPDRAPALDDPVRGHDPGHAQGAAARTGHAPAAARPARPLLQALPAPISRPGTLPACHGVAALPSERGTPEQSTRELLDLTRSRAPRLDLI